MKEYEVMEVSYNYKDTENELNEYAKEGWIVKCSYANGRWFVLERDLIVCKTCNK